MKNFQYLFKRLALSIPLLLLSACVGNCAPQQNSAPSQQSSKTRTVTSSKTRSWPLNSQIKALPNYGRTSSVFNESQNASAGQNFFQAYQAHQPGKWEYKGKTIEGDPFFSRFYYMGQGTAVYVEHDTRQDTWSINAREQEWCDRLLPPKNGQIILSVEGCYLIKTFRKAGH
jgi:hypothetical protein